MWMCSWLFRDFFPAYSYQALDVIVGNRAVLQRGADTAAVVFGRVAGGVTASASVGVTVTEVGVGSYTVAATVVTLDLGGGNLTWRAALKPHPSYGGSVSLTAQCKGCSNTTAATVEDVTYGDVWFCSGQSNMELPMAHALTRNRTYRALDHLGMYQNIRTFKNGIHTALDDRDVGSNCVTPPPPPPLGPCRPPCSSVTPLRRNIGADASISRAARAPARLSPPHPPPRHVEMTLRPQ